MRYYIISYSITVCKTDVADLPNGFRVELSGFVERMVERIVKFSSLHAFFGGLGRAPRGLEQGLGRVFYEATAAKPSSDVVHTVSRSRRRR